MKHRHPRHEARRLRRLASKTPPEVVGASIPAHTPPELQELTVMVGEKGPGLLTGKDPERVGLLAVHPRSPACPDTMRAEARAVLLVVPRAELEQHAAHGGAIQRRPPPGVFWCLLYGENQRASLFIGPAGRLAS